MTIESEITRINGNITAAYTACNNKGATMPVTQNSANLATCIGSISGGGSSPVISSLTVTPTTSQQTITAPSGTDGYSPITVNAVTSSIDSNITAGNIKKDVAILGVTGTYEGSGGGSSPNAVDFTQYTNYYLLAQNCDATKLAAAQVIFNGSPAITSAIGTSYTNFNAENAEVFIGGASNTKCITLQYFTNLTTLNFPKLKYTFGDFFIYGASTYNNTKVTGMLNFPELLDYFSCNNTNPIIKYFSNITGVKMPKLQHTIYSAIVGNCPALTYVNAASFKGNLYTESLNRDVIGSNCSNLQCLILGDIDTISAQLIATQTLSNFTTYVFNVTKVPDLLNKAYLIYSTTTYPHFNVNTLNDGRIFVPDALVNDFKAATNWSIYADFIKPMSQFVNTWES